MSESEEAPVEGTPEAVEESKPAAKRAKKASRKSAKKTVRKKSTAADDATPATAAQEDLPLEHGAAPVSDQVAADDSPKEVRSKEPKRGTRDSRKKKPEAADELSPAEEAPQEEAETDEEKEPRGKRRRNRDRGKNRERQGPPQVDIDESEVAQKAWKIFLGEVVEEGLALFDDRDARERAIKSFRLAEIFVTEQERRVARVKAREEDSKTSKEEKPSED